MYPVRLMNTPFMMILRISTSKGTIRFDAIPRCMDEYKDILISVLGPHIKV